VKCENRINAREIQDGCEDEEGAVGDHGGEVWTRTGQAPSLPDTKDEFNIVENFTRLCFR
jgi:hypothetical protein